MDWLVPYDSTLDRCWNRVNPAAMITIQGRDQRHDHIQLCTHFYSYEILKEVSAHRPMIEGPWVMNKHDKATLRAVGMTPVDAVLDVPHMIVRAVSRLCFYACNFGVRYQFNRVLVVAHARRRFSSTKTESRRDIVRPICSLGRECPRQGS